MQTPAMFRFSCCPMLAALLRLWLLQSSVRQNGSLHNRCMRNFLKSFAARRHVASLHRGRCNLSQMEPSLMVVFLSLLQARCRWGRSLVLRRCQRVSLFACSCVYFMLFVSHFVVMCGYGLSCLFWFVVLVCVLRFVVKCGHGLCCLRWFVVHLLVVQFVQELFPGRVPRRCWRTSPAPAGAPETITTTTATATTTTMRRRRRTAFTVTTNAAFLGAPTPR